MDQVMDGEGVTMDGAGASVLPSSADIASAADHARAAGRLGIDTEFMSEGRYRALLCLVQVVVDDPDPGAPPQIIMIDSLQDPDVTPLAAGFAGASAQAGYGNLLGAMLGQRVGKTASYTRWDARPLTAEQLGYAAEDVAHLLQLSDELQRRLRDSGRPGGAGGEG